MANETVQMLIKLVADAANFTKALDDAKKKVQDTSKEVSDAVKSVGGKTDLADDFKEVEKAVKGAGDAVTDMSKDVVKSQADIEKSMGWTRDSEGRLRNVKGQFVSAGEKAKAFGDAVEEGGKKAKRSLADIATNVKDVGSKIAIAAGAFGGAIVGGLGLAAKAATDFDSEFAKVTTLLDKEQRTPEFLTTLKDGLFDLGKKFGTEMPDNINAMYDALSSGVPPDNVLTFMNDAATAAVAGNAELGKVVDVTTSIMAAYNMKASDAAKINDILFAAVKVGKMEYSDLAQYLGQVLPVASAAGVSLEETAGAIAALTLSGFKPAQAVESLRSMLANVIKPSDDAKKAAEALGVEFNVAALKTKGLQGFMGDLFTAMKTKVDWKLVDEGKVDSANKKLKSLKEGIEKVNAEMADPKNAKKKPALQKKLEDLQKKTKEAEGELTTLHTTAAEALDRETGAAKLFGDVSGLAAALALGNNDAKNFNESMEATKNSTGAAADAFGAMKDNNPGLAFTQLKVTVLELMVNMGRLVTEAIAPLVGWLTQMIPHITDWIKNNPELSKGIVIVTGAVGALALAIGGIAGALSVAAGLYLTLTAAQAAMAGGATAAGVAAAASAAGTTAGGVAAGASSVGFWSAAAAVWAFIAPILAVIAIVALVIAALYGLYKLLEWAAGTKPGQVFFDWLVKVWDLIKIAWEAYWDWMKLFWGTLWEIVKGAFKIGADLFVGFFEAIGEIITGQWGKLGDRFKGIAEMIRDAFTAVFDWLKDKFEWVVDAANYAIDKAKGFLGMGGDESGGGAPVPGYAKGGIVNGRQLAYVGEAGPEAIIPLASGAVPVRLSAPPNAGSGKMDTTVRGNDNSTNNFYLPQGLNERQVVTAIGYHLARRKGLA